MISDEQIAEIFRDHYHQETGASVDRERATRRALDVVHGTSQGSRRSWPWKWPVRPTLSSTHPASLRLDVPSVLKSIAAAAIVALFTGIVLVGTMTNERGEHPVPAGIVSPSTAPYGCPPGSRLDEPGPVDQARPSDLWGARIAFDRGSGRIVAVTPGDADNVETWTFDVCTNTWQRMRPDAAPPWVSGLAYDSGAGLTVALVADWIESSGTTDVGIYELRAWTYDVEANVWEQKAPLVETPGRERERFVYGNGSRGHRLVYDPDRGRMLITEVLDTDTRTPLSSMWTYDVTADAWDSLEMSGDIAYADEDLLLAYDTAIDRVVACEPEKGATWLLDPTSGEWQSAIGGCSVGGRFFPMAASGQIAYDEATARAVVISHGRVVAYDGIADEWETLYVAPLDEDGDPTGPAASRDALVYDPINQRIDVMGDPVWAFGSDTRDWIELTGPTPSCWTVADYPAAETALPAIDPGIVPGADRFVLEDVQPGVRRLITDGAGHFPASIGLDGSYPDMLSVGFDGSIVVSLPPEPGPETAALETSSEDPRFWVLGEEGVRFGHAPRGSTGAHLRASDGSDWSVSSGGGVRRSNGRSCVVLADHNVMSIAMTDDGRVWAAAEGENEGGDGTAAVVFVIEGVGDASVNSLTEAQTHG